MYYRSKLLLCYAVYGLVPVLLLQICGQVGICTACKKSCLVMLEVPLMLTALQQDASANVFTAGVPMPRSTINYACYRRSAMCEVDVY